VVLPHALRSHHSNLRRQEEGENEFICPLSLKSPKVKKKSTRP
jgi:hypothetical protein